MNQRTGMTHIRQKEVQFESDHRSNNSLLNWPEYLSFIFGKFVASTIGKKRSLVFKSINTWFMWLWCLPLSALNIHFFPRKSLPKQSRIRSSCFGTFCFCNACESMINPWVSMISMLNFISFSFLKSKFRRRNKKKKWKKKWLYDWLMNASIIRLCFYFQNKQNKQNKQKKTNYQFFAAQLLFQLSVMSEWDQLFFSENYG